jgi:hypothetical protein
MCTGFPISVPNACMDVDLIVFLACVTAVHQLVTSYEVVFKGVVENWFPI